MPPMQAAVQPVGVMGSANDLTVGLASGSYKSYDILGNVRDDRSYKQQIVGREVDPMSLYTGPRRAGTFDYSVVENAFTDGLGNHLGSSGTYHRDFTDYVMGGLTIGSETNVLTVINGTRTAARLTTMGNTPLWDNVFQALMNQEQDFVDSVGQLVYTDVGCGMDFKHLSWGISWSEEMAVAGANVSFF